jgi:acetyl esterase/lipase
MKQNPIIIGLLLSLMPLHAQAPKSSTATPNPTHTNVTYGTHERNILDFWQAKSDKPTPLVIFIHGGGWNKGSKEIGTNLANVQALLNEGISCASINYRLIPHTKDVSPPVKAPMHDSARALQFLRSKAKDWNIDPAKVAAVGSSAGACSSLWLAYHDDLADPKSEDPISRESTRLLCAVLKGAQTTLDPKQMKEWIPNSSYGGHSFGISGFGKFLAERDRILPWIAEYSPYSLASKDDPKVTIFYEKPPAMGEEQKDPTHSANFGIGLQQHCKEIGIECDIVYPKNRDEIQEGTTARLIEMLTHP